jgi:hypothetical protein
VAKEEKWPAQVGSVGEQFAGKDVNATAMLRFNGQLLSRAIQLAASHFASFAASHFSPRCELIEIQIKTEFFT